VRPGGCGGLMIWKLDINIFTDRPGGADRTGGQNAILIVEFATA
jgi:hypothetical protein